ncbi:2-succinyl-6-hydroxy-2,4-cyclohexadiene-1-carboxylate synthase [Caldalkalibacillus thermarum TA2.A1]|uniref:Putative 2-succinyl-6-hydroxy-2,4-cyclohexadiene-1-carboxylate synthase n=1 Tax=Caldalkalibacillus thermarum (strain TA2.A1) TaxID=986075 RepID=F5L4C2_CALTT|nr:2-succinyl-6-hydroxy-2,4-cyclohexadiene-1-carboxylate synthase [Caldalkalibacillus thermarum]EGL83818.1 2-succinyl-6-hydroxy-2,4-cyclohexadiene-1-carboxylate synthase [Caldalkalibacillus thermarum TA2.A1]QZT32854.1 2-succinyl-6-hydroxy-2,4-cyclohexadiene-1-carboxylate synthase [Caldalkalibacillus thermarum TA2.A1]
MNIMVNGVRYALEVKGEGPPLLLLHGFTGSKHSWQPFIHSWSRHFTTIAIDLLGHGESDSPQDHRRYGITYAVQDLQAVLEQLGVDKINVLGYSMGGRLAIALASSFPAKVNSMVLESTSPGLKTEEEQLARRKQDQALAREIETEGLETFVHKWENIPLFASQKKLPEAVRRRLRVQRLSQSPLGLANSLRGMGTGNQPSFWSALKRFHFPVLVMAGEEDQKFCCIAKDMICQLPQATLSIIKGAGHTIHLEKPHIFDKVVLEYLLQHQS